MTEKKPTSSFMASKDDPDEIIQAKFHFTKARVDGHMLFELEDDAHVKADNNNKDYICRIVELFEAVDGCNYFTAQWYYRAEDTVIQHSCYLIDDKMVFLSEVKNDNPLNCLLKKLKIHYISQNLDLVSKKVFALECDYYYDMRYLLPYHSFVSPSPDRTSSLNESDSTNSTENNLETMNHTDASQDVGCNKLETLLLDLYAGCGAMSTGLCLGANSCGVNLITKWAVDMNPDACASMKFNHPETEVRNEQAEDFLNLIKEWEKICATFSLTKSGDYSNHYSYLLVTEGDEGEDDSDENNGVDDSKEFEVEKALSICYGDPKENGKTGIYFKIRWKGYGHDDDTWEPVEGLSGCQEKIKEFVVQGYKSKILPLPGDVDVICGGPPCQGISGFNRFRNKDNPLDDPRNKQLMVFMDFVDYLKPKFVLMENVVDILKFTNGFLGRYALGRLIAMNYQARIGLMAAGAYGLPQFRMRMFMWGARSSERLPQYPLPTHNVVLRGGVPVEFEPCTVAYEEGHKEKLKRELFLEDAISDLPPVENNEGRDEMSYDSEPLMEFQKFIRLRKDEMPGNSFGSNPLPHQLFDHRPLLLNEDDFLRVCEIPKKKGANFRDLRGVRVREDNKVEWDPQMERVYLPSGKPLVPDYAMNFKNGTSPKPFARLWWDETVPTVVTRAEPHNQVILHPLQDRVLTVRENARFQGFPDYYKLLGPVKERYVQVGNAVAIPVARALGYALALSLRGSSTSEPLLKLPDEFPFV